MEMRFGYFGNGLTSETGKCQFSNGRGWYNSPKALSQDYPRIINKSLPSCGVEGYAVVY